MITFIYLFADLNNTCGTLNFPRLLKKIDSAMTFSITQVGATEFCECAVQQAMHFAQQMQIPDLSFDMNLGFTSIKFQLRDIAFADFSIKKTHMDFNGQKFVQVGADGCKVMLSFKWQFTQVSYPYLTDEGTGKIFLLDASLKAVVGCEPNYDDCPGHFNILIDRADLNFDQLKLDLSGGSSWIYQSLINIILEMISKDISKIISGVLVSAIEELMTTMLNNDGFYTKYDAKHENIIKDERFVDAWQVGVGYLSVYLAGYIYNSNNLTDEFIKTPMLTEVTQNLVNNQLVYGIQQAAFNNLFYIMHKYYDIYSGETYKMLEPPTLEIMNANTLVKCKIQYKDRIVNMQLTGKPGWKSIVRYDERKKLDMNMTQVYFTFKHYSNDYPKDQDQTIIEDLVQMVVLRMQKAIEEAPYQLNVTPFIDFSYFYVLYDKQEQVIRFVGDNPEKCIPFSK